MTRVIHPTAIVNPNAKLGQGVHIGPYCIVGEHVTLKDHVVLHNNVTIDGHTSIGEGTAVFPYAVLGAAPQHRTYQGEPTLLEIGRYNQIREHVTMHVGSSLPGEGVTRVGDHGTFMVGIHVAHDCQVGNHVVIANHTDLAGHVHIGDNVIISGLCGIHQRVRIGSYAIIGGLSAVENDVIPFGSVTGNRARLAGLNLVGLKRHSFPRETIHQLRSAYRLLFSNDGTLAERLETVESMLGHIPEVRQIVEFIRADGPRNLCLPEFQR